MIDVNVPGRRYVVTETEVSEGSEPRRPRKRARRGRRSTRIHKRAVRSLARLLRVANCPSSAVAPEGVAWERTGVLRQVWSVNARVCEGSRGVAHAEATESVGHVASALLSAALWLGPWGGSRSRLVFEAIESVVCELHANRVALSVCDAVCVAGARTHVVQGTSRARAPDVGDSGIGQASVEAGLLAWAAARIQRSWRRFARAGDRPHCRSCSVDGSVCSSSRLTSEWSFAKSRRLGPLEAHVRFLQYLFRATSLLQPGCWQRGRLRPAMMATRLLWRDGPLRRCRGGRNLAPPEMFEAQRALSSEMLDWYSLYVGVLRRLESGETPTVVTAFCGGGGDAEGCRRAGGRSRGVDAEDQPDFARRFGGDCFAQGDATSWAYMARQRDKASAFGVMGGPPCKFYSTARVKGESRAPPLIASTRDMMGALFDLWSIENVMGARRHLSRDAAELRGSDFGLAVDRPRLIEANFEVRVDQCVRRGGEGLRQRCCLGARRRWRSFDSFGRPSRRPCCAGNLFAVQGEKPWRCTTEECARAMGVDDGHMSYDRLAQSVPPAYGQLVFAQMCMHRANRRFGVPIITFDQSRERPIESRREMARWLRGAGEASPDLAVQLSDAPQGRAAAEAGESSTEVDSPGYGWAEATSIPFGESVLHRELFYSHVGGFDQLWAPLHDGGHWLDAIIPYRRLEARVPSEEELAGRNTLVEAGKRQLRRLLPVLEKLRSADEPGTRVTLSVQPKHESWLRRLGWQLTSVERPHERTPTDPVFLSWGRRGSRPRAGARLVHSEVSEYMDPRDRGVGLEPKEAKELRSWLYYDWEPERWRGKGLPERVERLMTEGAVVESDAVDGGYEVRQYPWASAKGQVEAMLEADRALAVGAMEYVPADEVELALRTGVVHPWLIVHQGADKWRACHDYSVGTNRWARTAPFGLPSVWDVKRLSKPSSYYVKYDLRDGFYAVPVHPNSKNRLLMRHPATGRLIRCRRLPFGYLDSPRLFCSVTEAIAGEFRRRSAGTGKFTLVFVDDFLIVGDDEAAAREGGALLEQICSEFGLHWAPHKQRGPSRVMEFLGWLVCNLEGKRCIALTEKRQGKLRGLLNDWRSRRPLGGRRALRVPPKEMAVLLGNLVFASQVVPGGRTYMQGMLSQFSGFSVDWRRGLVTPTVDSSRGGELLEVTDDFWRDLEWWHDHLESRNCSPMEEEEQGAAAITGTDASDWGTGQLVWIDGGREEVQLRFTAAEQRRSINWRELLGSLRIVERFGERLRGRLVLIETDNTSAKGAAVKGASTARDMQELLRRLLEAADRCDVQLRFTHTPGAKLHRPDQTSRGDPVEEPRVRLVESEFRVLERRFGPFTELLGAERTFAPSRCARGGARGEARLWLHPTYTTVGSALRLLGERMGRDLSGDVSGIIIVPHDESAAWWGLTRYFSVVGRWRAGGKLLEMNRLGRWTGSHSRRDALVLSFPRGAGALARPVWVSNEESELWGDGYVANPETSAMALPMPTGSFVYSPGQRPGEHGVLYMVWRSFGVVDDDTCVYMSDDSDVQAVLGAQLTRSTRRGRGKQALEGHGGKLVYSFNFRATEAPANAALAPGVPRQPWAVGADLLWTVDHLVREITADGEATPQRGGEALPKAASEAGRRFAFDHREAEQQIARSMLRREQAAADSYEEFDVGEGAVPGTPSTPHPVRADEFRQRSRRSRGEPTPGPTPLSRERVLASRARALRRESGAVAQALAPEAEQEAAAALEAARASAEEAAGLRKQVPSAPAPQTVGQTQRSQPMTSLDGRQMCRYAGMTCAGCGGLFELGTTMIRGGEGMVHDSSRCRELAEKRLVDESKQLQAKGQAYTHSEKREVQLAHRLGDARVEVLRCCIEGSCDVRHEQEARTYCVRGCGRGVHVSRCLMMSKHRAKLGAFTCGHCRVAEIAPYSCSEPSRLLHECHVSSMLELTTGAEGTAANHSEYARMERAWVDDMCSGEGGATPGSIVLPRHSEQSFIAFLHWLVRTAERKRSFGTIVRAAIGVFAKLEITNVAGTKRVKGVISELEQSHGVEAVPCTHLTRRLITIMMEDTMPAKCGKLLARSLVQWMLELMGGVRVGEACGGGDGHGALANHLTIAWPVGSARGCSEETCELWLADSKTHYSRYVNFVGKSRGVGMPAAEYIRELWSEMNLALVETIEDGLHVQRPDYSVVRISILDMNEATYVRMRREVARCHDARVARHAKATLFYANLRREATTKGEEHRYVNLAGGTLSEANEVAELMRQAGLGAHVDVVPGPLLRATRGNLLTHMPLVPDSSYTHIMGAMKEAYAKSQAMEEPDLELDLEGLEKPKFGHHTNRRTGDKVARDSQDVTGAEKGEIDDHFGWNQRERAKDSQLHYAGRRDRSRRARITMML